jgi:Carboxypeptidase regulatory-like domain
MRSRGSAPCSTGFVRQLLAVVAASGLALLLGAGPGAAQAPRGSIRGTVYDSLLTAGPLEGARVELFELGRHTLTDARGVFRFDTVPAGSYTLLYSHPDLTALGFTPPERTVTIGAGIDVTVLLATPASGTIYDRLCPGPHAEKTGVLIGRLTRARGDQPLARGRVRGEWTETTLDKTHGVVKRPMIINAVTDPGGRYQLCGVPNDVPVLLTSTDSAGTARALLGVDLAGRDLAVRNVSLDLSDLTVPGTAQVTGSVRDPAGRPIPGALVGLLGRPSGVRTDSSGRFLLNGLRAGTETIEARAIGFQRGQVAVTLTPDRQRSADLTLARLPFELPELTVTSSNAANDPTGFDTRRERGLGGYFIGRNDILRRGTIRIEDLFKTVPGIKVEPVGAADYDILSTRGGAGFNATCRPVVFLDRVRIPLDPDLGIGLPVLPEEVKGIEIYQGPGGIPAEFQSVGNGCAIILIWTRRGGTP